ncbi:MAG: hydrolase [Candidatus Woesearchaeota archaeon]
MAGKKSDTKKKKPTPKSKSKGLKEIRWDKKHFYRVKLPLFSNNPEKILERVNDAISEIRRKGYDFDEKKHIILHENDKIFRRGDILIEIGEQKKRDHNIKTFEKKDLFSKSHIGHTRNIHESVSEISMHVDKSKKKIKSIYYWYVSHPKRPKSPNDYKTVIFAEIRER